MPNPCGNDRVLVVLPQGIDFKTPILQPARMIISARPRRNSANTRNPALRDPQTNSPPVPDEAEAQGGGDDCGGTVQLGKSSTVTPGHWPRQDCAGRR
jgi:hypothetical protein